ncbi:hypothetical protein [Bradyrhizobium sp. DASA03120]|uniref:hypothetical protein n=1 Tax=Bradyrhizobium sp. SMVTL-02 TaxID=3395917 RepID=UPI003F7052BE
MNLTPDAVMTLEGSLELEVILLEALAADASAKASFAKSLMPQLGSTHGMQSPPERS